MLVVNDIVGRSSSTLQDTGNIRYSIADLVKYASDGQRRVVSMIPSAYSATVMLPLVLGTRQVLPAGYLRIIDVVRNNNATGTAPGRVVRRITRDVLDAENIHWHTKPTAAVVEHYVYEPKQDPRTYWVYPGTKPPLGTVEASVSRDPPELVFGGALSIDPMWHEPLIDYVIVRALTRDMETGDASERAGFHSTAFFAAIGWKDTEGVI